VAWLANSQRRVDVDSNPIELRGILEERAKQVGLEVFDLRKGFTSPAGERLEVLRGVSFTAVPGEIIAITGVSGSGKSTLLHLLGGLESPDHGVISLDGADISRMPIKSLPSFRQGRVTFVFQAHNLLFDLSAIENVALPLLIARSPRDAAMNAANELLQEMELGERTDFQVAQLSGGEQQRVAIARALIGKPKLLLADEPTGNLDASMSEEITTLLGQQTRLRGTITLVATHSEVVARRCDRVMVLRKGLIEWK
jgi:lipoprotein-releasing system ATP-binding protein